MNLAQHIELIAPDQLHPYDKNARVHSSDQINKIAKSIKEFGFVNPILVDSKRGVIAGHGRLEAAKKIGLELVPIIVLDHLSETQQKALILADNRIAEDATWDYGILKDELAGLDGYEFDLEAIGFTDAELEDLLPEDEIPEATPQTKPISTSSEDLKQPEEKTQEIKKEISDIPKPLFEHKCPRCSHEFNT